MVAKLINVASTNGVSGMHAGRKFGFEKTTTDNDSIFNDPRTDAIVITTRHNSHADLVIKAVDSGKHVFVEKPLCLKQEELIEIKAAYERSESKPIIMVGFNRRFSPQIQKIKQLLFGTSGPNLSFSMLMQGILMKIIGRRIKMKGEGELLGKRVTLLICFVSWQTVPFVNGIKTQ